MNIKISKADILNKKCRKELIDYLAKDETKALFIIGNLVSNYLPAILYIARKQDNIVGVCGYYPTFKSCSIYTTCEAVAKEFAKKVIQEHSVEALLAMKDMALPAYEEFLKHGMKSTENPEKLFFQLQMKDFKPFSTQDGVIGPVEKKDIEQAVKLQRLLDDIPQDNPITEEERAKVAACSVKFGLKIENKLVSVASSNGLAIKTFQILGVATEPNYRKKGYAKAVCSRLISHMKDKGAQKAIIFTESDNFAAIKCYENLGFQIVDKYYLAVFK